MASVDSILSGKYPAKSHAKAVANYVRSLHPALTDGHIYLESIKSGHHEDSDQEVCPLRQRRAFFYLSGCALPDCYLLYRIAARILTLYIPPINPADVLWSGLPLSPEEAKQKYDVDEVRTTDLLDTDLRAVEASATPAQPIFVLRDRVSREFTQQVQGSLLDNYLKTAIDECRAIKDPYEVALIKRANTITASAHHAVMAAVKTATNERDLAAIFLERCMHLGAPTQAYTGIFAAGRAAATLHYVHNDKPLAGKLNLLLDAGAELDCYASDVTRTFPISGTFSKESREIYDIVLNMQKECLNLCKPGQNWDDVHVHAHRLVIEGLLKLGILKGGSVEEILESRTSCAFLPHGLGHYLGMDTHDTGGHPNYDDPDKMFCYLRKRGPLPVGAVITVEPGVSTQHREKTVPLSDADPQVDIFLQLHHSPIPFGPGTLKVYR
jgi:Xaa-Pro dipeptidase